MAVIHRVVQKVWSVGVVGKYRQEYTLKHFRVFSFVFHLILFSVKTICKFQYGFQKKKVNAGTLQRKYKPRFEWPENSVLRLHKSHARGRKTYIYVPLKKQNWAYSGLENK